MEEKNNLNNSEEIINNQDNTEYNKNLVKKKEKLNIGKLSIIIILIQIQEIIIFLLTINQILNTPNKILPHNFNHKINNMLISILQITQAKIQ